MDSSFKKSSLSNDSWSTTEAKGSREQGEKGRKRGREKERKRKRGTKTVFTREGREERNKMEKS